MRVRTPAVNGRWIAALARCGFARFRLDFAPVLKVLIVGPESLSGVLGPTVLGRPDIDSVHIEFMSGRPNSCVAAYAASKCSG